MKIVKPNWVKHETKGVNLSIFSIDIHPDGTKFATGGQGNDCGHVAIWNMQPVISQVEQHKENVPKLLSKIDSHLQCVNAVRWCNSGSYLASAGDDQLIMIWTLSGQYSGPGPTEQYRTVATLRSHSGDILDLSWSHDDQWLASCSVDNMVVVWNAQRWPEIVKILNGHSGLVKGITWDPIGKYLASQSDDKTLRVWRVSDWSEEVNIQEPFGECGGTTHFLRLSWSPDGQFLVSAQAMNNCGSVAKIIERQNWSATKDFVGHRKAIPCVRFNSNIFKFPIVKNKTENKATPVKYRRHCVIAMGSRDRSISIWATDRNRPLITIADIFKNSVLDISWTKNGYQLMACSSDGSVVYLEFTPDELGLIYSEEERAQYLQQLYGNSFGSKSLVHNNLIEDVMMLQKEKKPPPPTTTNGVCKEVPAATPAEPVVKPLLESNNSSNSSTATTKTAQNSSPLAKGPTDKQIEIRSADGKRRIIPLFIPPAISSTGQNSSTASLPANIPSRPLTFSSSSESKSKIVIETRDESNPALQINSQLTNGASPDKEETKMTQSDVQSATITKAAGLDIKANNKSQTNDKSKPPTNGAANQQSSSIIQISDDSSDEVVVKRQRVTTIGVKRKSVEASSNGIVVKRKPGRPPGSGCSSKAEVQPKPLPQQQQQQAPELSIPCKVKESKVNDNQITSSSNSNSATTTSMFFPPLKLDRQNHVNLKLFTDSESGQFYSASIEYPLYSICKLSLLIDSRPGWNVLLSSGINAVTANEHILVCICEDRTVNIFATTTGKRIFVPIMLESHVARMTCCNKSYLLLITCNARLWLWDVLVPKVLIKGESLLPLLINPKTSEQLSIHNASVSPSAKPIVTTSNGRTYVFEDDLSSWCLVNDLNDPLRACTDLKPCAVNVLKSLASFNKIPSRSILNFFSTNTSMEQYGLISFIEQQIESSKILGSGKDYRYWILTLAQNLINLHSSGFNTENIECRLRDLCTFLLGNRFPRLKSINSPSKANSSIMDGSKLLGFNRHELLRDVLSLFTANLSLQRLYIEFKELLDSFESTAANSYHRTEPIENNSVT